MFNWRNIRAKHLTEETFSGFPVLNVEKFGRSFRVIDPDGVQVDGGIYARHNASTFFDDEPCFVLEWGAVSSGDVVVDVGTCLGSYSISALALGASVVGFEPNPECRQIVKWNAQLNGWDKRLVVIAGVAGDGDEYPPPLVPYALDAGIEPTATVTVDEVMAQFDSDRIDWLKSDCEGLELGVITGAMQTIERWHPTLIIEDHDSCNPGKGDIVSDYPASIDSSNRIQSMLRDIGYKVKIMKHSMQRRFIIAKHPIRRTRA